MTKSNPLVQLLHAVEAAGYATVGSYETSAEWHAAAIARLHPRDTSHARPLVSASSTLMSVALAMLLVFV